MTEGGKGLLRCARNDSQNKIRGTKGNETFW